MDAVKAKGNLKKKERKCKMARMLTEEEVKRMEEQRALQDRARAAGNPTAGMSAEERTKYVFQKAHEDAMERRRPNVLANPGAEADTGFRHRVLRDEEMRTARAHQMDMLGKELATREEEARQKRHGMAEQGMEAAKLRYGYTDYDGKYHAGGEARLAEIQAANAEKIAGINTASAEKIAGINTASNEKVNKDKNDAAVEVANINKDATVEAAGINARAQAAQQYAQDLMKRRNVGEQQALNFAESRARLIAQMEKQYTNKQGKLGINGKFGDAARAEIERIVDVRLKNQLPGKPRVEGRFIE